MLWLGIIIGMVLGAVVGVTLYHFFVRRRIEERVAAEERSRQQEALSSFEKEKLKEVHVEADRLKRQLVAEARAEAQTVTNELAETHHCLEAIATAASERAAAAQKRVEELQRKEKMERASLDAFREAYGKLARRIVDAQKEKIEDAIALEEIRLIQARNDVSEAILADQERLDAMGRRVASLAAEVQAMAAYRNALVHGAEGGVRVRITEQQEFELKELWRAIRGLRLANPAPLFKACFELYLRPAIKEAFGNVPAGGGIYAITDTTTGLVYVGKTTCFKDRWLTHLKRGGYYEEGTAAGTKLYGAMKEHGV